MSRLPQYSGPIYPNQYVRVAEPVSSSFRCWSTFLISLGSGALLARARPSDLLVIVR